MQSVKDWFKAQWSLVKTDATGVLMDNKVAAVTFAVGFVLGVVFS